MITLFGQHAVTDYDAWLSAAKANLSDSDRNAQWGIVGTSKAYRTVDGSAVVVVKKFNDLDHAQKYANMMQSAESHAMMEKIGAKLPLTVWITEEA
jgi:hypothetical protein